MRIWRRILATGVCSAIGCVGMSDGQKTAQVSSQFFESAPASVAKSMPPAADESVCVRVDFVGRKVVAANQSEVGMRPLFATIQSPTPEIFHVDQKVVYVTDGLVKQLPSEADLAAVLSYELARMVAERESRVKQDLRQAPTRPPIQVPIGGAGGSDMVSTVEMARYDAKRRDEQRRPVQIDPESLARGYLEKAGFARTDFDRVQPQLRAADQNSTLERQVKGVPAPNGWVK